MSSEITSSLLIICTLKSNFLQSVSIFLDLLICLGAIIVKILPSFTPGYYEKGDGKDLGSILEFKSELIELVSNFWSDEKVM